jgi:hypothetical protein
MTGQECGHTASQPWFEFCQQLDKCAPAFDSLVCGNVSAHGARIGFLQAARQAGSVTRPSAVEGEPGSLQQSQEFVGHEPGEKDCGDKQSAAVSIPISHPEIRAVRHRSSIKF